MKHSQHSQTAYVILGLLSIEDNKTGYDIRKAVEETVGYFWSESYGQIYPTLKRLAAQGLIVAGGSGSTGKRRRQEYSLTDAGHACLREWLGVPFKNDPPRNEFLLKLFFGREAAPRVAIEHVKNCNEKNRQMLDTLNSLEKLAHAQAHANPHQPYWMLTLGLGVMLTRAALEWGERALETMVAMEAKETKVADMVVH